MNNEKWPEVKLKIKEKFSKLSDRDIDGVKGSIDKLTSKVENVYHYTKGKAQTECKPFTASLS
ncbi:hypothetical protein GW915_08675 [bacterium]|nr:hypothetical protein [bacterium]